jgi:hypothetical protein
VTDYERSGQPWKDDPAAQLVDQLYQELSEELGTEGPVETFGHADDSHVGHLVEDDEGVRADETSDVIAHDSHDTEDLAAEELAMHYLDEDSEIEEDLADLPEDLRRRMAEESI